MTNERPHAVGLEEGGVGIRQVARMMGFSPQTIINLRCRYQEMDDRPRPGAERVMIPAQDRSIVLQHLPDGFRTAVQAAAETPGSNQSHHRSKATPY